MPAGSYLIWPEMCCFDVEMFEKFSSYYVFYLKF